MLTRAFSKLSRKINKFRFDQANRGILCLGGINNFRHDSDVVLLSMVQKKDVNMFFLAARSFTEYLPVKKIIVIADPSIDKYDREKLKKFLKNVDIYDARKFRHEKYPVGGTWERLAAIAQFSPEGYIIQLDADTLTTGDPLEVRKCVTKNMPFIHGTNDGQEILPLDKAVEFSKKHIINNHPHVQLLCEANLDCVKDVYGSYVRGCSGFAGFPKNSITIDDLFLISDRYKSRVLERWNEWGTEQFASNLILSNIKNTFVLPVKVYGVPYTHDKKRIFNHFIGSLRYKSGLYASLAKKVIDHLY